MSWNPDRDWLLAVAKPFISVFTTTLHFFTVRHWSIITLTIPMLHHWDEHISYLNCGRLRELKDVPIALLRWSPSLGYSFELVGVVFCVFIFFFFFFVCVFFFFFFFFFFFCFFFLATHLWSFLTCADSFFYTPRRPPHACRFFRLPRLPVWFSHQCAVVLFLRPGIAPPSWYSFPPSKNK